MYSGDEYYGDDVTSPLGRSQARPYSYRIAYRLHATQRWTRILHQDRWRAEAEAQALRQQHYTVTMQRLIDGAWVEAD